MGEIVGAIIVSAGFSTRMKGIEKAIFEMDGVPLVIRTAQVFERSPEVDEIVLVVRNEHLRSLRSVIEGYNFTKIKAICIGGRTRRDSVKIGLESLSSSTWVIVHDGARPMVTNDLIVKGLKMARKTGAATPGLPPKDAIKMVTPKSMVIETLERDSVVSVQTPQTFRREILERAHKEFIGDAVDDAVMVEKIGIQVAVYPGSHTNIKVTTPEDLKFLEVLMKG